MSDKYSQVSLGHLSVNILCFNYRSWMCSGDVSVTSYYEKELSCGLVSAVRTQAFPCGEGGRGTN